MGQVAGYTVADYLIQHAIRERRYARVPVSTWDAALSHLRDPDNIARLAHSARNRLLYGYAILLFHRAAEVGDWDASRGLAGRGDLDGLCARADAYDRYAVRRLAELLAGRGDLDGLRARADAGDGYAAVSLAGLLEKRGDLDGAEQVLRALIDADDGDARRLAGLLEKRAGVKKRSSCTGSA
jgi:hypothetical protein